MGILQTIAEGLWLIEGPVISVYGLPYGTRMAVARLADGGLWLWSPVRLDDEVRAAVASLGEPRYVVEPNKFHHLPLRQWVDAWPGLQLYAAPGLPARRRDLQFVAELGDAAPAAWRGEIEQVCVAGSFVTTEVAFFHRASKSCLLGDLIQKQYLTGTAPWQRWVFAAGGVAGPGGGTPALLRLTVTQRDRARAAARRILGWEPRHLIIAHGHSVLEEGAAELRRALAWLDVDQAMSEASAGSSDG